MADKYTNRAVSLIEEKNTGMRHLDEFDLEAERQAKAIRRSNELRPHKSKRPSTVANRLAKMV